MFCVTSPFTHLQPKLRMFTKMFEMNKNELHVVRFDAVNNAVTAAGNGQYIIIHRNLFRARVTHGMS